MGIVDVDAMLAGMPSELLHEWRAYLDYLGETDDQLNTATITTTIVNELRELRGLIGARYGIKQRPKFAKSDDYVRKIRAGNERRASRVMTPDQIRKSLS